MGRRGKPNVLTPDLCFLFYQKAGGDSKKAVELLAKVGVYNPWTRKPFSKAALMRNVQQHPEFKRQVDIVRQAAAKAMKS